MPTDDISTQIVRSINTKVQAAVLSALAGDEVIGSFVQTALMQPVDMGRGNMQPFVTKLIFDSIQQATAAALNEYVLERTPEIRAAIERALADEPGAALARALIGGLAKAATKDWMFRVEMTLPEIEMEDR